MTTPQRHAPRGPVKAKSDADPMPQVDPLPRGHRGPRCSAHSKRTGLPCQQPAMRGGTVCKMHGGKAPQVMEAAAARLRALQHPALDALHWLITQREFPSAAMSAARDVMDRIDGKPHESVAVAHSGGIDVRWQGEE